MKHHNTVEYLLCVVGEVVLIFFSRIVFIFLAKVVLIFGVRSSSFLAATAAQVVIVFVGASMRAYTKCFKVHF